MTTRKITLTYSVPNILLDYQPDKNIISIRQGGPKQIEQTVTTDYMDAPVDETPFIIKAKNQINFGTARIEVLNDKIDGDKPLAPSAPTAAEYMANVGKEVTIFFNCSKSESHSREAKKDIYRVIRTTIVLP